MAEFRYFSPVPGKAAPRYGTRAFIGARREPSGFVWDDGAVVPIPLREIRVYLKEYGKLLNDRGGPALIERTRADYEAYAVGRGFEPVPDGKPTVSGKAKATGLTKPTVVSKTKAEPTSPVEDSSGGDA